MWISDSEESEGPVSGPAVPKTPEDDASGPLLITPTLPPKISSDLAFEWIARHVYGGAG